MTMRLLFHLSQFNMGGAEMSTLRLLHALIERGASITLVLTEGGGMLEAHLDPRIKIVHLRPGRRSTSPVMRIVRCVLGWARALMLMAKRYDGAVVGMTGTQTGLIRYFVRAPFKLHFIRNDLTCMSKTPQIVKAIRRNLDAFSGYVCVSEIARRSLVRAVPEAAAKAHVIYNILNAGEMRTRAQQSGDPFLPRRPGAVRILSVCRLQEAAKGLRRMARVCRQLDEAGFDFDWYVMGDGPDRALFEAEISAQNVGHRIHLMGRVANPFPGYAAADLVAMLSNYEGLCGVINEAKVMGRAIVATRVSGVDEQLIEDETGLVAEQDEQSIVEAMQRALCDASLRARLTNDRLPAALLDDESKLDALWSLFQRVQIDAVPQRDGGIG